MSANTTNYRIQKVACQKNDCPKEFNVIVDSIYTAVTRPVSEIKTETFIKREVVSEGIINDYIVVSCPCETKNNQRVYLKKD